MIEHDDLTRVFWPLDGLDKSASGVLVGWRNSPADFFVVSLLENAHLVLVQDALKSGALLSGASYPLERIYRRCGKIPLEAIGLLNPDSQTCASSDTLPSALILHTDAETGQLRLHSSFTDTTDVQVVIFRRPQPVQMQFVSLEPISLALTHESDRFGFRDARLDELDAAEQAEKARTDELVNKMRQHTVRTFYPTAKESKLRTMINQINCCYEINVLLQRNADIVRTKSPSPYGFMHRIENFTNYLLGVIYTSLVWSALAKVYPAARKSLILILMGLRVVAEVFLVAIETKVSGRGFTIRDISATAQQIDLRLQQFCYWPIQYQALRERRKDWRSITNHHTEYIRFFNSQWLVANDIIIGVALGSFLMQNADSLAQILEGAVEAYATSGLRQSISWLTQNPGGLKLNNELAQFLGNLFVWIIDYWAGFLHVLEAFFPQMIRLIALTSIGGATLPIAICSDMVSILTMHIHCFYLASARIYYLQLTTIISQFHLFRGKKRNVLRNRIDSCDYELDQLLLGTVMFTLLTFLLPTVLVFYSAFAFARTAIIILKAILDTMLAALNHFPLFALMLRVKDSRRLPGGIEFQVQASNRSTSQTTSYIRLEPIPLSVAAILQEYFRFGSRIQQHYFSRDVLFRVATGRFVPGIPRRHLYGLQYSMLPAQRVGIADLWKRLDSGVPGASQIQITRTNGANASSKDDLVKINGSTEVLRQD